MIVLSAGMQKSGTGWYFNLTNDLLVAAGFSDVRVVRERFRLQSILRYHNCNIGQPSWPRLARVLVPHLCGHTLVIKTHAAPTPSARLLMSVKMMKATYTYRDPRDIVISAFEHGQRIRDRGQSHTFAQLDSVQAAIFYVKEVLGVWDAWMQCGDVLRVRYEDLLAKPQHELQRLCDFLCADVSPAALRSIISTYQADQLDSRQVDYLHFDEGRAGRFREVMSQSELDVCDEHLGHHLRKMGYAE